MFLHYKSVSTDVVVVMLGRVLGATRPSIRRTIPASDELAFWRHGRIGKKVQVEGASSILADRVRSTAGVVARQQGALASCMRKNLF